jgi:hypothetical protein
MPLQKLQFRPGVNREGTIYSNEGGWYDMDHVRFRSGLPEKIGGWTQFSPNQFLGICRSLWVWLDGDLGAGALYVGLGTNSKYYIYFGGVYNDITPIVQTSTLTNPFATTSGSKTIVVTDATYQPSAGDYVYFSGATSVGGVLVSGDYIITSILSSTTYTIVAAQTASSTATGGGTVTAQYEYPSGNTIYSIGTGWGAGPYGGVVPVITSLLGNNPFSISAGSNVVTVTQPNHGLTTGQYVSFSGATTLTTPASTYSFTPGTYAISASLGATISGLVYDTIPAYYLNAQFQITYVNTNTYTITIQKTAVANMTGGGSNVVVTEQSGTHGWGTAYSSGIGSQLRLWSNDNFGADLVIAPRGGAIFYWQDVNTVGTRAQYLSSLANTTTQFTDSSTFGSGATSITVSSALAPNLYPYAYITGTNLPANTQVASNYVTGSTTVPITTTTTGASSGTYNFSYSGAYIPNQTYQVITSEVQEFIIAFGANNYVPGQPNSEFNPLLVRWSDQANQFQWIPELTNQAGEYTLSNGSFIMGARATRQEILVWTDSAIYSMQYIGAPYVWGFQILMDNISIMSPNAMITVNNVTYWMGRDRFYMYNGTVQTLACSLKQYIFEDINQDQAYQVFAGANEGFNEIWWFYCSIDGNGGTETNPNTSVDKYVIYNYLDNIWYYGTMARTAWLQTGTQPYPIAADYNNRLLNHENGNDDVATAATLPIDAYIQSSDFDIGDGQQFGFVWRMLPDINFNSSTTNQPSVTMQLQPRQNSGTAYNTSADNPQVQSPQNFTNIPAYTVNQFTGQVYTRVRGRQMAFRVESTGVGTAWQLGAPRIDIRPDGRR